MSTEEKAEEVGKEVCKTKTKGTFPGWTTLPATRKAGVKEGTGKQDLQSAWIPGEALYRPEVTLAEGWPQSLIAGRVATSRT